MTRIAAAPIASTRASLTRPRRKTAHKCPSRSSGRKTAMTKIELRLQMERKNTGKLGTARRQP
jgi:hypothetical protein